MAGQTYLTEGPWSDEASAAAEFDALASVDPRFREIHREVRGAYTLRSPFEHQSSPRIDRILMPSKALLDTKWETGPIGVEIKAPGTKLGVVVSQCLDYLRASFEVRPGYWVTLGQVAIFCCPPIHGDLLSVMVQGRVLACRLSFDRRLTFWRNHQQTISLDDPNRNVLPLAKVGSR